MLIPSIDLMGGRIVQLVQGERLALESDDVDTWIQAFSGFPIVQLIDLDAAMGRASNDELVRHIVGRLPCQVGGGVRTLARAETLVDAGALRVILGSTLFHDNGVDVRRAAMFAEALTPDAVVGAIDSRGGRVVIHGWRTSLDLSPEAAAAALEPFVGALLYTHVDTEGLMTGLNTEAVMSVHAASRVKLIAAGGIRTRAEVDRLDACGIDAVVGMAIYTGAIALT